ncbi:MAG: hypothetical protein RJA70_3548, partial [Pseudomonadota bacterium]
MKRTATMLMLSCLSLLGCKSDKKEKPTAETVAPS